MKKEFIEEGLFVKNEIEQIYKNKINIYNINPNIEYFLGSGNYNRKKVKWELITDGFIKQEALMVGFEKCFWENPSDEDSKIKLKYLHAIRVELEKANYAVMLGFSNTRLDKIKIYTNLLDMKTISKIIEISSIKYLETEGLISKITPYVRQITLK